MFKKKIQIYVVRKKNEFGLEKSYMFSLCKKKKKKLERIFKFVLIKENKIFWFEKKKSQICFYMCKTYEKDFLRRGFHSWNKFMLCVLNKKIKKKHNKHNHSWSFSLFQNLLCYKKKKKKNSALYLRKIQINFFFSFF